VTYFAFLCVFIALPLFFVFFLALKQKDQNFSYNMKGILALICLAVAYTTPWDNYLLYKDVWWYSADRVLFTIGYVPIEEYSFFILQTLLTGLWTYIISRLIPYKRALTSKSSHQFFLNLIAQFSIFLFGVYGLFTQEFFYMGLILAWSLPVIMLQFSIGGHHILSNLKNFCLSLLPPTLYLWSADAYAISDQIWIISSDYTTGVNLGVLPIEEALFFLVTNVMVVQGLMLFNIMRNEIRFSNFRRIS
jgi:putative membrane protein